MLERAKRNDVLVRMDADCIRLVLSSIWYSSEHINKGDKHDRLYDNET